MKFRKLIRILHRDLGYFIAGMTLIYSLSGIYLNHRHDFNPDYRGGRCFLMGSNEDFNIRVEAGEKIGAFNQEQMGNDLTIRGILKEVRTEAEAHNPEREHGTEVHEHDGDAEEAHRIIIQAQDKSEAVYFIEGLEILNEKS